ncbi:MAG TPA: 50S ribosomal protein L25 [Candidatus Paceibacterota bacterium]
MDLAVQKREDFGKKADALREAGFIPAELYGHGTENLHLSIPVKDFSKVFKEAGENTVVNVIVDGKKHPTLIYDVQYDPVLGNVIHADFYEVRMDEKIKTHVPVEFIGDSPAVKEKAGIVVRAIQEIEVEALPIDLPHVIEVDLGLLTDIGASFHVKDLKKLSGVEFLVEPETVIATVTAQMTVEEEAALAGPVDVTEVKVETEEEKATREALKTESGETTPTEKATSQ